MVSCLLCCWAYSAISARAAVVAADIDGDGWAAFDANLGVPWTTTLVDMNSDVWGSGQPVSGLGVAFSGPATLGQFGLFDDHIAESTDLAVNLDSLGATAIFFNFYQDSVAYSPNAFSVFFRDFQFDDWYLNVDKPVAAGWSPYMVDLTPSAGWYSPTGGTSFSLAMSGGATQQMGIRLQYAAGVSVEQRYGLANYQVLSPSALDGSVPEASTTSLLLFGGVLLWAVRRSRMLPGLRG